MKYFMRVCHKIWSWFKFQFTLQLILLINKICGKHLNEAKRDSNDFHFLDKNHCSRWNYSNLNFDLPYKAFKIKIWERYLRGNKMFHGLSSRKNKQIKYYIQKIKMQLCNYSWTSQNFVNLISCSRRNI
jgi:hypothetical protein